MSTESDASSRERLQGMIAGYRASHLVGAAAEFGVADLLVDGPKSSDAIAAELRLHAPSLGRAMRALAELGVFNLDADGGYGLTAMSRFLLTDTPASLRGHARFSSLEIQQRPWTALQHTIRTGETAFDHLYGVHKWEYLAAHPDVASAFNNQMTAATTRVSAAIVRAYDFGAHSTVVDVGGSNGVLIAAILNAYPAPRGILFDLPAGLEGAREYLDAHHVADRCEIIAGSFFEAIPPGGDVYTLKRVIHDWDDTRSIAILRSCRMAMLPSSKLLLIELLMPEGNGSAFDAVMFDVAMMVQTGGVERTEEAYGRLLADANLRLVSVTPIGLNLGLVEAVPG
jgi:hypothetical protein